LFKRLYQRIIQWTIRNAGLRRVRKKLAWTQTAFSRKSGLIKKAEAEAKKAKRTKKAKKVGILSFLGFFAPFCLFCYSFHLHKEAD